MTRERIVILLLAVAVTALVAVAIAQAASSTSTVRTTKYRLDERKHATIAPILDHRFSVLTSAKAADASGGAALPAQYAAHLTEPGTMVSEYQLEPAMARYVDLDGTHAWAIPGKDGICLGIPASNGGTIATSCGSLASAGANGILIVERPISGPVTYGLVPDGDSVAATDANGSTSSVSVTSNFFVYKDPGVQSISIRKPDGRVVKTIAVG